MMWRFILNNRMWFIGGAVIVVLTAWLTGAPTENPQKTVDIVELDESSDVAVNLPAAAELYQEARSLFTNEDLPGAKELYQKILNEYPEFESAGQVQKELEDINMAILFSGRTSGNSVTHEVVSGDTLGELAKKYGTTVELIKRKNKLKSDIIRIGQRLQIWTSSFNIFVDKSQNILMVRTGDEVLKTYRVSTGEDASTPTGEFKITTKLEDPVWFNKGVVVPPDSPANVLGSRWLGFDVPGYGIHGTIEPESIGQSVTAGCVRMRNKEVEELYSYIPRGTKVVIVD